MPPAPGWPDVAHPSVRAVMLAVRTSPVQWYSKRDRSNAHLSQRYNRPVDPAGCQVRVVVGVVLLLPASAGVVWLVIRGSLPRCVQSIRTGYPLYRPRPKNQGVRIPETFHNTCGHQYRWYYRCHDNANTGRKAAFQALGVGQVSDHNTPDLLLHPHPQMFR